MSFPLLLRHRLKALGTEQRDLAAAAQVTESYISQLVTGKKRPPAPERTDIYDRMETFLKLPAGELARLAELERREAVKRMLAEPPTPLLTSVRELMLRKCAPAKQPSIRAIFEREPFGALEHLVIQKLLDVVKKVAREELGDEAVAPPDGSTRPAQLRTDARHRARLPGDRGVDHLGGSLRGVSRSADRVLGYRPGDLRHGNRPEPPAGERPLEAIRVRRTRGRAADRRGAGAPRVSQGSGR